MTSIRQQFTRTAAASLVASSAVGIVASSTTASAAQASHHPSATSAANGVTTRAQVPWSSVGGGWAAADVLRGGANHLVLASPAGQVYEIATLPKDEHVDQIAADGKHVITKRWSSKTGTTTSRVWDMRTARPSSLPTNLDDVRFTRPTGTSVMGFNEVGSYGRYSATGAEQLVKIAAKSGVGTQPLLTPNPQGAYDAVTSWKGDKASVALYSHADFTKKRTYGTPAGYRFCTALAWQDASTLLKSCMAKDGGSQIFTQKITGGTLAAVTSGRVPGLDEYSGFIDAGRTSVGTVAIGMGGGGGDAPQGVWLMKGTKATTRLDSDKLNPGGALVYPSAVIGDKVVYFPSPFSEDEPTRAIVEFDVKTKKYVSIVGHGSSYDGVIQGSAVIDPRQ